MGLLKNLMYLRYLLVHKWYVFCECVKAGIPWRGIVHDWHKLLPDEWIPYANYFYGRKVRDETGYYKPTDTGDNAFDMAWLLHQKRARHHWQWWILPEDEGGLKILPMSEKYRKEMLCDWIGASKAQGFNGKQDVYTWYQKNKHKMQIHPDTREWIELQLEQLNHAL